MIIVRNRMRPRLALVLALALCGAVLPVAAKDHKIPAPKDASTYACHDEHAQVVIAAEPYNTKEQGKIFRVDYVGNQFMPIYFVVTNNSDEAISLDQARIDFISSERDRIPAAVPGDVERRMTHLTGPGRPIPMPAPLPPLRRKPKTPDKKIEQDFDDFEYSAATVPPHSTRAGFFFYDMQGLGPTPLKGARLAVRDIRTASGKELFTFEIPFDKYL